MAIRLRKIEDDHRTVQEIAENQRRRQTASRKLRISLLVLFGVIAVVVFIIYLYSGPNGKILVKADVFEIKTPANSTVEWMISPSVSKVKASQPLVMLSIKSIDMINLGSQEISFGAALLQTAQVESKVVEEKKKLEQEEIKLQLDYKLAEDAKAKGKNSIARAKKIYEIRKRESIRVKRLWNLDAISIGDAEAAERIYADANAEYKNAVLNQNSLDAEYKSAKKSLDLFLEKKKDYLNNLNKILESSEKYTKKFAQAGTTVKPLKNGQGYEITLAAPASGEILYRFFKPGEYVQKGESVLNMIGHGSIKLTAYVRVGYFQDIKIGSVAKIKIGPHILKTKVKFKSPEVVSMPQMLLTGSRELRHGYFRVEFESIKLPPDVLPGQTGKVVFH
jgi:hypothetical protein